ncbi:carboxypeptidase-like regulatory domain-containing protein [Flavobacterium silvisoli]|uniref:Carboxypeptidase-like regulatory domain-containing protein n=1 Tax=Flavobacterium silvisoli TaxID=2529433 RepID=A0A4Q9Z3B7_9FLAO|nr:DUF5686 and carboxypeptidase-like regulatory domain-containing protein [Flavobacterium silvisoli]TBX70925.1 carboxypeptidase-like regulatory domain-containing protein [Flavobacterium silvisoli]
MKHKFAFFVCLIMTVSYGQGVIQGTVIDKESRQPLAFANLSVKDSNQRMVCDVNGKFSLIGASKNAVLVCSHVGYEKGEFHVDEKNSKAILIELMMSHNELVEVVVGGDNPANAIISKVIANKELNNPERLQTFQYSSYNKIIYDYNSQNKNDSVNIRLKLKGSHFFMMESVTQRKFMKPDLSEEVVLATKVSGFKNPSFASVATDFQPFSFYQDNIKFFNVNYLNPISKGSLKKYKFHLEDTLINEKDTVFIISYKPKKHKNFDGLKGLLYINSNKYAVQNVIATPAEKGKIDIKIQQKYSLIEGVYWFPEQLNFAIQFNEFPKKEMPMIIDGKTYISEVKINLPLEKKKFSSQLARLEEDATTKDSVFWKKHRIESLSSVDVKTYRVIDSIGEKMNFDIYLTYFEKILQKKWPLKYVDIDLSKTLLYNKYEGLRIGSGFYTNEAVSKKITLGGFMGYGVKDELFKYGGEFVVHVSKKNEFDLGVYYQDDLMETGGYGKDLNRKLFFDYRKFIGYQYDYIKQLGLSVHFRSFDYFLWDIRLNQTDTDPKYLYEFNDNGTSFTQYKNTSVRLNLRFAYKEKFINSFNQNISTGTKYPILYLSYTRGVKNLLGGNFDYNKTELALEHSFYIKSLGNTSYRLEGGYIDNTLPYGLLFTGEGSYDKGVPFIMENTFQTMAPYEFLSNRYVNLFWSHNFGGLLFKQQKFQPILSWHNNMGWGALSRVETHQFIEFKTKNKLFLETGLQLDNLIKLNYMNLADIGFGAGGYYRYGYYTNPEFKDNVAFKFTLNFSIK